MEHQEIKRVNNNIMNFTEDAIKRMTCNYNTSIGRGGFGEVYRGFLGDDHDLVAVKKYIYTDLKEEFMEEVSIHSQINHKNVVKLIGYCFGKSTLMMVTKYISRGNLEDILHNSENSIPLEVRLGIAIGCAEALCYMHSMHLSSDSLVCHGDIKPANILLDENLTAKVSDFGLSRLLSGGITRYTRNVKGSSDYVDPIYLQKGRLTPKSDVYSFGIVVLELITRRRVKEGNSSLIENFSEAFVKGKGWRQLLDAEMAEESNVRIFEEIVKLATECLSLDIDNRPRMNDVAERLRVLRKNHMRYKQSTSSNSMPQLKKSWGIFKWKSDDIIVPRELGNVRIFTKGDITDLTQNYSHLLDVGWLAKAYKGTLEDNTAVVVKIYDVKGVQLNQDFMNVLAIQSHIAHKNIIKLLGCCLETEIPIFVYEYAPNGNLSGLLHGEILNGKQGLPLELRMKIAVNTAEALEYLHSSSSSGAILHGCIRPANIMLDENFTPKVSGFSLSRKLTKDEDRNGTVVGHMIRVDPFFLRSGLLTVKSDVYSFGIILLELICRTDPASFHEGDFILEFAEAYAEAYHKYNSGKTMFDKDITGEDDVTILEEIGKLSLKCTSSEADQRPKWQNSFGVFGELGGSARPISNSITPGGLAPSRHLSLL